MYANANSISEGVEMLLAIASGKAHPLARPVDEALLAPDVGESIVAAVVVAVRHPR